MLTLQFYLKEECLFLALAPWILAFVGSIEFHVLPLVFQLNIVRKKKKSNNKNFLLCHSRKCFNSLGFFKNILAHLWQKAFTFKSKKSLFVKIFRRHIDQLWTILVACLKLRSLLAVNDNKTKVWSMNFEHLYFKPFM